jgi:CRISPR-associated protein Csd1
MGVSWIIILNQKGDFIGLSPYRQKAAKGNKLVPTPLSAPTVGKRTSGDKPGFLVDKSDYIFGCEPGNEDETKKTKLLHRFELFRDAHLAARTEIQEEDFDSVCAFLQNWDPTDERRFLNLIETAKAESADVIGTNLAFQISGKKTFVHQLPDTIKYWSKKATDSEGSISGFCLVTGKNAPLARLHDPAIKSVAGAQSSGASIVSFNLSAFLSYGKEQSLNAPVSEEAAFAYCTTLNYLLANRSRRFRVGDATTVFWTAEPTPAEEALPWMISGVPAGEDEETKERVSGVLEKIARGTIRQDDLGDASIPFYILGLSPNASRLSVRFWHTGTLGDLLTNVKLHFEQLRIIRQWDESNSKNPDPIAPSVFQLLRQTARDADGISPLLGGALLRAILLGTRYPDALVNGVMNRIRVVEKKQRGEGSLDNISYLRAAILKAWLIRNHKLTITEMLDETNTNTGYRLGRLFSVLEKTQQDALPGINTTIRERFYSSASATPRAVFGRLLRMYPHHLEKAHSEWIGKFGREKAAKIKTGNEIKVQEILNDVSDFPAHLNLQNQAQFALGYYHQRKALFPTKPTSNKQDQPAKD